MSEINGELWIGKVYIVVKININGIKMHLLYCGGTEKGPCGNSGTRERE